ncbi:MAG: STAS domain-containing protein [Pirellulaceae bacterium]
MLLEVASDWSFQIDRGPDWLFIRPCPPHAGDNPPHAGDNPPHAGDMGEFPLAETIWGSLEQAFCHRVVVELDDVHFLRSWLVGELVRLHKRVTAHGGMMRVCGLSAASQDVLRTCRLLDRFPAYANRTAAVMGHRPQQPR